MQLKARTRRALALSAVTLGGGLVFAAPSYAVHQTVYGLTDEDPSRIVTFAVGAPQAATGPVVLADASGLPLPLTDDNLVGIDYRPRTNTLYGASDNGVLYRIAPPTAMAPQFRATSLGTITDPADVASGFGFNPAADRLRLSNVNDDNLRIDVDARTTTMDGVLAFAVGDANFGANPQVAAADYTNSFDGTTTTTLFNIEAGSDVLVDQTPANSGTLNTVGSLGVGAITEIAGLDIEGSTGTAYAALNQNADSMVSKFYRVNLTTGAATQLGTGPIAGGELIESVTLPPTDLVGFNDTVSSVAENGGTVKVSVTRTGPINQQGTVTYTTELPAGSTATADDFTATTGVLTFAPGDATESFTVPITDDTADESDETFGVRLQAPISASMNLATPPTSTVNIVDNDDTPVTPVPPVVGKPGAAPLGLISAPAQRLDRSIKVRVSCDEACGAGLTLSLGRRVLNAQGASLSDSGNARVTFRLSRAELKAAKKKAKTPRGAKLRVAGVFTDADGTTSSSIRFRIG